MWGQFWPKKCPSEYCLLDVDLCSSRLAYPYWSLKSLFCCMQDPGSYSVVPSHHMNKFSVCPKTPQEKSVNFWFFGWAQKFWAFCVRQTLIQKKLPLGILSEQCGSKTIVLLYIKLMSTCTWFFVLALLWKFSK